MNTNTKNEILKADLRKEFVSWRKEYMKSYHVNGTPGGESPDNNYMLFAWFASKLQEVEREKENEIVVLRSDIARAIGRMQGLGYPDTYLEKRYPELAQLKGETP